MSGAAGGMKPGGVAQGAGGYPSQISMVNFQLHNQSSSRHLSEIMKDSPTLKKEMPEYQRLEYCLKMNLRLVNGSFDEMIIHQISQTLPSNVD